MAQPILILFTLALLVPFHIETWAYDAGSGEGSKAPPALVAKYITYAESAGDDKVLRDCHTVAPRCVALHYIDANRNYYTLDKNLVAVAHEDWWLHVPGYTDFTHRLKAPSGKNVAYLLNQSTPGVQAYWQSYIRRDYDPYDGLMADDTSPSLNLEFYGTGYESSQELTSDEQVVSMHEAFAEKLTHRNGRPFMVVQNTVNPNPFLVHGLAMIGHPPNVIGLVAEGVPVSDGKITTWYPSLLDIMAQVNRTRGFLVLLSYGSGGHAGDRYAHIGTMWLGYSPGHEVSWEDLADNDDLAAWPEETIYPTQPLQSMSNGNGDLTVAFQVWRREFRTCYLRGRYWGHCAALVNTNTSPAPIQNSWLTQRYSNTIEVRGGDVEDPRARVVLAPLQTTIPANGALLLYGK